MLNAWSVNISFLSQMRLIIVFTGKRTHILARKQWVEKKNVLLIDIICCLHTHRFSLQTTLIDGLEFCGLLWVWCFNQLFELSFWRHPFTVEDPLVSKWCNATFVQICSYEETNSSTSGWHDGEFIFIFFGWTITLQFCGSKSGSIVRTNKVATECTFLILFFFPHILTIASLREDSILSSDCTSWISDTGGQK